MADGETNSHPGRNARGICQLREGLIADFAPRNTIERELVDALQE